MPIWSEGPSLADEQQRRRATQKPVPHIIEKKARKQTKAEAEKAFRDQVRARDENKSRASGVPVSPTAMDWDKRAEVHHRLKRSTNPEERLNVGNGITLTKTEHKFAETRCPDAPEHHMLEINGPDDMGLPQRFVWRDRAGKIAMERVG